MATVKEVCKNFAETTTISGLYFIAKYSKTSVKLIWILITIGLLAANVWQSYGSVKSYFDRPTVVVTILDYKPLTFPAVTFCSANPYVSERVKALAPPLDQIETQLSQKLYGTAEPVKQRNKRANSCTYPFQQNGSSCYYRPGLQLDWNSAVSYCANYSSTLPIFYSASDYLAFADWWNTVASSTEVWLGLTYDLNTNNWTWMNNCPWKHLPSFWRACWDIKYSLCPMSDKKYSKYSNKVLASDHSPTGVEPVSSPTTPNVEVVCYQPLLEPSTCHEFPFEKNANFLCNKGGWWCATENALGQNVSTAVASDSCFCLQYFNETLSFNETADDSCATINGTLADIRNADEQQLINTLIDDLISNEILQNYVCPNSGSYFNGSCFLTTQLPAGFGSGPPGWYTDDLCTKNNSLARGASLHSFDEQCSYKNDTSSSFTYQWYDGSSMDYVPKWGYWGFNQLQNDQFSSANLTLSVMCDDGNLGDDNRYFDPIAIACRLPKPNFQIYPILTSSYFSTSQLRNLLNISKSVQALDPYDVTSTYSSQICRKDRNTFTTTTSTSPPSTSSTTMTTTTITFTSTKATTAITSTTASTLQSIQTTTSQSATTGQTNTLTTTTLQSSTTPAATSQLFTTNQNVTNLSEITTTATTTKEVTTMQQTNLADTQTSATIMAYTGDGLGAISEAQERLLYEASTMDPDILSNASYTLDDIMPYCSFNGSICLKQHFKKTFYPSVGNCYTYNILHNPLLSLSEAGAKYGLELVLHVNISTYLLTSLSPGFLIAVHDQNDTIFPDSESIRVVVGQWNLFSTKKSVINVKPYPYSDCVDITLDQNANYSVEGCNRLCLQQEVLTFCKCGDPSLPIPDGVKYCNWTMSNCVNQVKNTSNATCSCNPTCSSVIYDITSTVSKLRNTNRQASSISTDSSSNDLLKNAVQINIFYSTLSFTTYEQIAAYGLELLVSDLANFLGLWLGFSIMTFFEFISFSVSLSSAMCKKSD